MNALRCLVLLALSASALGDTFVSVGSMAVERSGHTATLLADGRVLIAGGHATETLCEIYDPAARTFRPTAHLSRARFGHSATLLTDGRILIAGGGYTPDFRGLPFGIFVDHTAELFDPASETFVAVSDAMAASRQRHTATLLPDGRVLLAGGASGYVSGFSYSVHPQRGMEVYDPTSDSFVPTSEMSTLRSSSPLVRAQPSNTF